MDMSGREGNTGLKEKLTYFCSGVSLVCLMLTLISVILSFISSKSNQTKEEKSEGLINTSIFCNISFCLVWVNLMVITSMDKTDEKVNRNIRFN
jgi:high-affinity nickel permease